MSKTEVGKNRAPIVLIVLLLAQLLLMSSQVRAVSTQQPISLLRSWVLTALYPIQVGLGRVGTIIHGIWYGYFDLRGAHQENLKLRKDNERLQQELLQLREVVSANQRLSELVSTQKAMPYNSVVARVIARGGNEWFNKVIIDRGSLAGLKLDQPVITPGGIVGRIIGISPLAAQVQLITDGYAAAGGRLVDSRAHGEVKGLGKDNCEMRNVSGLEPVKEGEAIITTGLDGIYPEGFLIGYVEKVALGGGAKNHQISVRPAANLDRLEEVLVLQLTEKDLRIEKTIQEKVVGLK